MEWYESYYFPTSTPQPRILGCCIVSSLTIVALDFLTYVPEDIRILKEHRLRFPSLVYLSARVVTLVAFVQAFTAASRASFTDMNGKPNVTSSVVHGIEASGSLSHRVSLIIQRGLTSLLLYLRVDALYQSNRYIQVFFGACVLAILGCGVLSNLIAGISTGVFDLFVFLAIVFKIGWSPVVHSGFQGRTEIRWKLRIPFNLKRKRGQDFVDRILRDSLLYVVIAILFKIPQIAYLISQRSDYGLVSTVLLDPVITCIISCKIFRDMKLGQSHHETAETSTLLDTIIGMGSNMVFAQPVKRKEPTFTEV